MKKLLDECVVDGGCLGAAPPPVLGLQRGRPIPLLPHLVSMAPGCRRPSHGTTTADLGRLQHHHCFPRKVPVEERCSISPLFTRLRTSVVRLLLAEAEKDAPAGRDAVKGWEARAVAEAGKDASVSSMGWSRSTSRQPGGGVLPTTTLGKKGAMDLAQPAAPGPIPSKTTRPTRHLDERGEGICRGELGDGPTTASSAHDFFFKTSTLQFSPSSFFSYYKIAYAEVTG
jgi:hypothetical protein